MPEIKETTHLKDLWNEAEAQKDGRQSVGPVALPLEPAGRGFAHHQFRRRQHELQARASRSVYWPPGPRAGRERQWRGSRFHHAKLDLRCSTWIDWSNSRSYIAANKYEDEMVRYYPLSAFGENRVAASIDTPLHAFLPFPHVDHLHPDWAIALAASANGKRKLDEFNKEFDRKIVWVPWQRPGFELALMIERAVKDNPGAEGLILGGHGLFTWGMTQRDCYLNSIHTIDQMGEFILKHQAKKDFSVRRSRAWSRSGSQEYRDPDPARTPGSRFLESSRNSPLRRR